LLSTGAGATDLAADACGKTLTGGGIFSLKQDLTCACEDAEADVPPALTLVGPVELNLNGKTLSCGGCEKSTGIVVQGERVRVENGTVSDCMRGIEVKEGNSHRLQKLTIAENLEEGVRAKEGNNHRFVALILARNGLEGLRSEGSKGLISNNKAFGNGEPGFRIDGDSNRVRYNLATDNVEAGLRIKGDSNRVRDNLAVRNGQQGIRIQGDGNTARHNQTWSNGEQGIVVEGDGTKVIHNVANRNCRDGIEIDGGSENALIRNIANHNGNPGACPSDEDLLFGIDYRPWFYAGLDTTGGGSNNRLLNNRTKGNLGCWVSPEVVDNDEKPYPESWAKCTRLTDEEIHQVDPEEVTVEDAVARLRNRNLWDENAELVTDGYLCNSTNEWVGNWSDGKSNAKEECPCVEGIGEDCKLGTVP
jgi:parallel beta-helix repeat protein